MLRYYAEQVAPEKFRDLVQKAYPGMDVSALTWAEVVAIAHLEKAAEGNLFAIGDIYKHLDDDGAVKLHGELSHKVDGDINAKLGLYDAVLSELAAGSAGVSPKADDSREPVDTEGTDRAPS
jgi:hypothetical protein